jgi:hypothetical protein
VIRQKSIWESFRACRRRRSLVATVDLLIRSTDDRISV